VASAVPRSSRPGGLGCRSGVGRSEIGRELVCLLIVLSRTSPEHPLVVAANRDELLDRPAQPMVVLREASPRVLGGRDLLAGGTWLAVNEHGVVAGLTNGHAPAGRDASRKSRGELPMALASHASAELAVDAFATAFRPSDYNPAWMLVGDRTELFFVDMNGGNAPVIEPLPPGIHVLENRPLDSPSAKADYVRSLLAGMENLSVDELPARLQTVLADHHVPASELGRSPEDAEGRPPPASAACVHTERYGTRWSGIVTVGDNIRVPPGFCYADGPACTAGFRDATPLWLQATLAEAGST
jgi:uncharacterized protein with NRDE domain